MDLLSVAKRGLSLILAIFLQSLPVYAQSDTQKKTAESQPKQAMQKKNAGGKSIQLSEYLELNVSGQLNQAVMYADDGARNKTFYGDNEVSASRIRFSTLAKKAENFNAFSNLELGIRDQSSQDVSQIEPTPGNDLTIRIAEAGLDFNRFGKLTIGHGLTASDTTAEVDLSGTDVVQNSAVQKMGGGLLFSTTTTGSLTGNPSVGDVLDNLDGLGRLGRVRYDSPTVAGLQIAGSIIEESNADVAIRYDKRFSKARFAAALGFESNSTIRSTVPGRTFDGSASILFNNGFNATIAGGKVNADTSDRSDPAYHYCKLGYQMNLFNIGKTSASVDYGRFVDYAQNEDTSKVVGAVLVQSLRDFNTDLYVDFRQFSLDRPSEDFDKINLVAAGLRVKF